MYKKHIVILFLEMFIDYMKNILILTFKISFFMSFTLTNETSKEKERHPTYKIVDLYLLNPSNM